MPRKIGVRRLALLLVVLAIGVLGLAWVLGGPVPMRTIAQDVPVTQPVPAGQVKQ